MNCETFEALMIDELYGELDDARSREARAHVAECAACAARMEGLRATRRTLHTPLEMVDPPPGLEERILARVKTRPQASAGAGAGASVARLVSLAGSWAMRPQTAMAAVFLVMFGASVLLIRGKSSRAPATATISVTEKGAPAVPDPASASDLEHGSQVARAEAPRSAAPAAPPAYPVAKTDFGANALHAERPVARTFAPKPDDRSRDFAPQKAANASEATGMGGGALAVNMPPPQAAPAAAPAPVAAAAPAAPAGAARRAPPADEEAPGASDTTADFATQLAAARAVRDASGCRAAVGRLDALAQRAAGSLNGWLAQLDAGRCYRALGDRGTARARLVPLLDVPQVQAQARSELRLLDPDTYN